MVTMSKRDNKIITREKKNNEQTNHINNKGSGTTVEIPNLKKHIII
jgi:hypothetical protein